MNIPEKNSQWSHKSGTIYTVVAVSNLKATKPDYPVTVVYEDCENNVWSHPLAFWHERMTLISK